MSTMSRRSFFGFAAIAPVAALVPTAQTGNSKSVVYAPAIDANGTLSEVVNRMQLTLARDKVEFPSRVKALMHDALREARASRKL